MSPKSKPTLPIDIYVRVSRVAGRDVEAEGGTASEQEAQCRAQLAADRLETGEVFVDLDESGGKTSRPAFDRAMARIEDGVSGGIIVKNLRRFGRTTNGVIQGIEWIEERGAVFLSCEEKLDTSTPMGRFVLTILAALGQMELEERRDGWNGARSRAVARGVHVTSTQPAGYTPSVVGHHPNGRPIRGPLVPNEHAPAVLKAFQARANGASWTQVARLLTDAGVPTSHDTREGRKAPAATWSASAAARLCENRVYLGEARSGYHVNPDAHEPIVSKGLWAKVQARKQSPSDPVDPNRPRELLAGIVRCSGCGNVMTPDTTRRVGKDGVEKVFRFWRCKSEGRCSSHASIGVGLLEDYVVDQLAKNPEVALHVARPKQDSSEKEAAEARLADAEAALEEFTKNWRGEGLSPTTAAKMAAELEREVEGAVEALNALPDAEDESYWEDLAKVIHGKRPGYYGDGLKEVQRLVDEARVELDDMYESGISGVQLWSLLKLKLNPNRRRQIQSLVESVTVTKGRAPIAERVSVSLK